mmetsp:Transcript_41462/g.91078  ORF Transcript_41462/g.91078 Transcript_41462/m.91078 type:complete len:123 (-) Transcript_41462:917-1285(-)
MPQSPLPSRIPAQVTWSHKQLKSSSETCSYRPFLQKILESAPPRVCRLHQLSKIQPAFARLPQLQPSRAACRACCLYLCGTPRVAASYRSIRCTHGSSGESWRHGTRVQQPPKHEIEFCGAI